MASFTVNRWRCDRCGIENDRWLKPGSAYSVVASVNHGVAGGPIIEWRELCGACNSKVSHALSDMQKEADLDREQIGEHP